MKKNERMIFSGFYLKNARERGICKYALFELGKFKKFLRYICQMLQSVSKIRNDLYPRFFEIRLRSTKLLDFLELGGGHVEGHVTCKDAIVTFPE